MYSLLYYSGVFQEQEKDVPAAAEEDEAVTQDSVQDDEEEEVPCRTVFVNTRRGKGNGTKRKLVCEDKSPPSDAQVFHTITYSMHTLYRCHCWADLFNRIRNGKYSALI